MTRAPESHPATPPPGKPSKKVSPRWPQYAEFADCGTRFWVFPGNSGVRVYEPTREIFRHGQAVRLETRPFDMLMMLLRRPGRILERDTLREVLWGGRPTNEDSFTKCASKLRLALGGEATGLLTAAYGRGYRLAVTAEPWPAQPLRTAARAPAANAPGPADSTRTRTSGCTLGQWRGPTPSR